MLGEESQPCLSCSSGRPETGRVSLVLLCKLSQIFAVMKKREEWWRSDGVLTSAAALSATTLQPKTRTDLQKSQLKSQARLAENELCGVAEVVPCRVPFIAFILASPTVARPSAPRSSMTGHPTIHSLSTAGTFFFITRLPRRCGIGLLSTSDNLPLAKGCT